MSQLTETSVIAGHSVAEGGQVRWLSKFTHRDLSGKEVSEGQSRPNVMLPSTGLAGVSRPASRA